MMQSFHEIIQNIRTTSINAKQAGTRFEVLILRWFLATPLYEVKRGWLWLDFAKAVEKEGNDLGIDLVLEMADGEFWAVQCKFYNKSSRIDEDKVAHFLGHQGWKFTIDRKPHTFDRFVWVDTDAVWGKNAETYVHGRENFTRLSMSVLASSNVDWDAIVNGNDAHIAPKKLRDYQKEVVHKAEAHFKNNDRGKVIMACGTGKTLTSQRIAEAVAGTKGTLILYCVPSIALLGQTYQSWAENAVHDVSDSHPAPLFAIGVCSDNRALEKKAKAKSTGELDTTDEASIDSPLPATTSVTSVKERILAARQMHREGMSVVFTTYQSLQVVADAQQAVLSETDGDFGVFDMIICDEAHRTTGAAKEGLESSFMKVHDNDFIQAKKRLYMTATPRIYTVNAKADAKKLTTDAVVCSMDDVDTYGEEIARISFGQAVNLGCLSDYKVIILTVDPKDLPEKVVSGFERDDKLLDLPTATRLVGAIHGLSKQLVGDGGRTLAEDPKPCTRALLFATKIGDITDLGSSKNIEAMFPEVSKLYLKSKESAEERLKYISIEAKHVDGSMNTSERNAILSWLAGDDGTASPNVCRVVSNVRCLSEGVDVPALDAVVFMAPKKSQIDIVQSVGRVMRNFRRGEEGGKKYGYIILPVALRPGENINEALEESERFKEVWSVLCALRSHDENFNAQVNAIRLNMANSADFKVKPGTYDPNSGKFIVGTTGNQRNPVEDNGDDLQMSDEQKAKVRIARQLELFEPDQQKIFAKLVDKVGTRNYWEGWASDVGKVALDIIAHMNDIIERNPDVQKAFDRYLKGLQKNINNSINAEQAAEMLGQHIIVGPIFDALFADYHFNDNNAVSKTLARMVKKLQDHGLGKDTTILNSFYASIRNQIGDLKNPAARQQLIKELYNRFFAVAFPKTVQRLGIVYTPVQCVDFIIHSVEALMQKEFGRSLSDENVHILDPFVGTGTFITRLLQSGIIKDKDLKRKYLKELHCNEIVLLAYYVADVNIETVFHSLHSSDKYINYDNICLTDTFELYERGQRTIDELFKENTEQIERQCKAPIQVIIGNPPYSRMQKNANDDNQNLKYPKLDNRIAESYLSGAVNNNSMYDPYIRAFRWASDRIANNPNGGVIGFITNGKWLDANTMAGFRKSLCEEFDSIYVLDLQGGTRGKDKEGCAKAGGNVFNILVGVCMTFLVKHDEGEVSPCAAISQAKYAATPSAAIPRNAPSYHHAHVYYHNIGDYLSRDDKLKILTDNPSILSKAFNWTEIIPDEHGDWLNKRVGGNYDTYPRMGDKKDKDGESNKVFCDLYSLGINTNRDVWCYGFSIESVRQNMSQTTNYYNQQRELLASGAIKTPEMDSTRIKFCSNVLMDIKKNKSFEYADNRITDSIYRP
ncbi:MAG: DEAD/DEAH box helicase, partial [Proteobacteria bacterium]|nr:DEAD/DEAH box helicase [Pseudomonadota bacterium]